MTIFFSLITVLGLLITVYPQTVNFDTYELNKAPKDFTTDLTGKGRNGNWVVIKDDSAPGKPNVLAQTDMDETSYRFPVCVYDKVSAKDVEVSTKFKTLKGKEDQAAGLVWRYKDKNNYYVVRANALEGNIVLYKVVNGKRTDLPVLGKGKTYGVKAKVPSNEWHELKIVAKGNLFSVHYDGRKLFDVEDKTFTGSGKAGLWTKADSYTLFDDLTIKDLAR